MEKKPGKRRPSIADLRAIGALALLCAVMLIACASCARRGSSAKDAALLSEERASAEPTIAASTLAPLTALESERPSESESPLEVNVRIFVPGNDVLPGFVGHYDVEICGRVEFRGRTFTDPVFSYGANQSEESDGNLEIFDAADTTRVYAVGQYAFCYYDCALYQWHFEIDDPTRLEGFLSSMDQIIATSAKHPRAENGLMCTIVSENTFSRYQRVRNNCFYAAALWMFRLGDPTLLGILRAAESGLLADVLPATVAAEYVHYLEPLTLK